MTEELNDLNKGITTHGDARRDDGFNGGKN